MFYHTADWEISDCGMRETLKKYKFKQYDPCSAIPLVGWASICFGKVLQKAQCIVGFSATPSHRKLSEMQRMESTQLA